MNRIDRWSARALAALLAVMALYGLWSTPGLAARWGVSAGGAMLLVGWLALAGWVLASARRTPGRAEWTGFALLALALRIGSLVIAAGRGSTGDPHWYTQLAGNLLAGHGLIVFEPAMGQWVHAEFPPAYPLLLAGWGAVFGLSMASVLFLSTMTDLAAAAVIARIGARLGDARAGRAAGALWLIWPSVVLDAPLVQKESLELLLIATLALGWLGARPGWRGWLAIGFPAGLLALTQPAMAPLAALMGLALLPIHGWRRVLATGAPAAAIAILVLLPWWVRNWLVFGRFVPLTSVGGLSLWVGENPDATGNWMRYPPNLAGLAELDFSRAAGRMAAAWMGDHPAAVAKLNAAKLARAIGVGQFGVARLAAMRPPIGPMLQALLFPVSHAAQMLLCGFGAAVLARRPDRRLTALAVAALAQMLVFGLWFEFGERHREGITPFLLLAVAMTAARWRAATPAAPALKPQTAPSAPVWARQPASVRPGRRVRVAASPRRR